jgi:hypothetical protein
MPSQNVTFDGTAPSLDDPELAEPEGASILLAVRPFLKSFGWDVGDLDVDHGAWSIVARKADVELRLMVTGPLIEGAGDWFLQIGYDAPGLFSRVLGKAATATPADCFSLAQQVHECLGRQGFTHLRWRADGPPTRDESTPEPIAPV